MKIIKRVVSFLEKRIVKYPLFFRLYSYPYKNILKKEIALADISKKDRVLNIGCGSVPFSAIYTAQLTGANVFGIDIDEEACNKAVDLVRRLDLENKLKIFVDNGVTVDPSGYTVILIALQAAPKKDILQNLLQNADKGTRIIFRIPRHCFENQYGNLPKNCSIQESTKQLMLTFDKSVLLIK